MEVVAKAGCRARNVGREPPPRRVDTLAIGQRRVVGSGTGVTLNPRGKVHARQNIHMTEDDALDRIAGADHGIFCTLHAERGVDAVPVAFAITDGCVGVPVDLVKPKTSLRLQRERNLEADARATLLVEHWNRNDWSRLWWVRAELHWQSDPTADQVAALADRLAERYPQYEGKPFHRVLVLRIVAVTGWSANG
jgi:hypothetical protein